LAKAMEGEAATTADPENSPTLTLAATRAGVILGTAAYMSPEQAHGKPADRRADIWAFGVVLFEMLTGRKAFSGQSVSDTLAAVLKSDVDWQSLPAGTPIAIRTLLRQCLAKDRKRRLQAIGDARLAIEEYLAHPAEAAPPTTRSWVPWGIAALLFVALLVTLLRPGPRPAGAIQASILPPEQTDFHLLASSPGTPVLSPDGRKVAIALNRKGEWMLYVRDLDQLEARPLAGTEGAQYPFWSPDSRWLGYFTNQGRLSKIEVAGGLPIAIADVPAGKGGTWSRDGVILFTPHSNQPIFRVSASGGPITPITRIDAAQGENSHREPEFLPDGRHFLFVARGRNISGAPGRGAAICVGSLDGQPHKVLMPAESQAMFVAGCLLFVQGGSLVARPFDPDKLDFIGDPVTVAKSLFTMPGVVLGAFSASSTDRLVYLTGQARRSTLTWLDRTGRALEPIPGFSTGVPWVELAPDLRRVLTTESNGRTTEAVSMVDLSRGAATRITTDPAAQRDALWLPGGNSVLFASNRGGKNDLNWMPLSTGASPQVLYQSDEDKYPIASSPDGRKFVYWVVPPHPNAGYWILPLDGASPPKAGTPVRLAQGAAEEYSGAFSPDGKWFAHTLRESTAEEIFIIDVAGRGHRYQVSTAGGVYPRWKSTGKELFYLTLDGKMMSAPIQVRGDALDIGTPTPLFDTHQAPAEFAYDVTPDGKRFLVESHEAASTRMSLTLVTNWTSGLKK
jgi:Tol biopolymer transport system component